MRKRMTLEWSAYAWADRDAIFNYIEADSPPASCHHGRPPHPGADRNVTAVSAEWPPSRIQGTRELVISRTPYVVAYLIEGNIVRILRVLHGSRRWPDDIPEGTAVS